MTTNKPLNKDKIYGDYKFGLVIDLEDVESAVQLLKEKISKSSLFNDNINEVYDLIDEAFPVFKEEDKSEKVN